MKSVFVKILKISLIVVAVILIVLLVFGLVLRLDWPLWVGFFLILILVSMGIGAIFLRKILLRRREQRFVQQVIEQDESRIKSLTGKERDEMKELQDRWKEAIEALKRSHLRKYGNPLYVLPWYLVIGESGSGKTTAINSAHLSSPFVEVRRTSGISGTKNCDWWFFEQAIIIDTAGRYALPVDEGKDKEEWQKFLNLMIKYRKKEPIHGLIVTVAANKLLEASSEALEEDGRNIRRRIDELMRVLGIKFPVYVLVTKCDLVQGMTRFCEHLPEKNLDQPMGFINQDLSKDIPAFLDRAFSDIAERLRNLRLLLLHQPESKVIDPGLLLFPEEFENLKRGLDTFMKSSFQENPYQETPLLRGLFFSSGRQEGSPYSHFLNALGLIGEKEVLPGTNKGLFLHDFFARILPADRGLFAPTRRAIEWRTLTRNLGLISWIVLGVAVCGLLSFSFVKNLKTIREVTHEFASPPVLKGELLTDLITMDRFRQAVLNIETQNRNWWVPRFGLNESIKVEVGLKDKYCRQFQQGFLSSFDKQMSDVMPRLVTSPAASDEIIGQYIVHLVRRINLLKARLDGEDFEKLKEKPQPSYVSLLSADQGSGPEVKKKFGYLYLYYLTWRSDTGDISKEIAILQAWLKDLLTSRGKNLQWLVIWVNKQGSLPSLTLGDFWGGSLTLPDEKSIEPAFTRKGKEMADFFIKEIESALPDPVILENQKTAFDKWYLSVCFDAWQSFGTAFPKGAGRLKGVREWQQMAAKMATDQGPYFAFLNKIALELESLSGGENLPAWLKQAYKFQVIKAQGYIKDQSALGKAAEEGKKLMAAIEKKIGKEIQSEALESRISAVKAYQEYQGALALIMPASTSRTQAYQMALQVYSEDPVTSKSPFYIAYGATNRLNTYVAGGRQPEEMIPKLITGPLDFLWTFVRMETACYLQSQWEEKVLAEAQGATGLQATQMLLAPEGPVWKFVKGTGTAAPFIGWSMQRGGYYAKEALGGTIPFDAFFFSFLVKGAKVQAAAQAKQSNNVTIRGLPTDANPDAGLKPHGTRLELQCAAGSQILVNLHYPVSKVFNWSPDTCGDVIFQIDVGDLKLTKRYMGPQAFPEFLQDFKGGKHIFYPDEFPREKASLDRFGIKYIKVNYQFSGEQQVVGQVKSLFVHLPRNIVRCWGQ
jgi:type VI secretion system protein ImpL